MIAAANAFFGVLALLANLAAVGLAVLVLADRLGVGAAARLRAETGHTATALAGVVAAVATAGSLFYSEVAGFVPCVLCWWQRIFAYPLVLLLLVGAARRDPAVRTYGTALALAGLGVSVWHYLLQHFPVLPDGGCTAEAPCTVAHVWQWGFVSIPYMAGSAFVLILLLLWWPRRR